MFQTHDIEILIELNDIRFCFNGMKSFKEKIFIFHTEYNEEYNKRVYNSKYKNMVLQIESKSIIKLMVLKVLKQNVPVFTSVASPNIHWFMFHSSSQSL